MNKEEVLELIKTGEGLTIEFKERISSNIGKDICAFANLKGGNIILGVRDNGEIIGIVKSNALLSNIQNFARNMSPPFSVEIEEVDNLIAIHIPEGKNKPYSVNGQFYLRIGSNSQQLNHDEIRDFFQKENLIQFDSQPNTLFDFENDFDEDKFNHFLKLADITNNLNKKEILKNLFLLDSKYLKNAGVLFFSRGIKKFFLQGIATCVLYQGSDRVNILDRKDFDSDILSNYNNSLTYLKSKLNTNYIIKAERVEKLELPEEALREALINSFVHRDYFSNGHIQIDIFTDRVEISNPGGLVSGLKEEDFGKVSLTRNPLIMDLMLRANNVEKIGSGIRRIQDAMRTYGLGVEFKSTGFFTVVFQRPTQATPQATPQDELTELEKKIIAEININPKISRNDLVKKLGISPETIKEYLAKLKIKGALRRVGQTSAGHWEIIK